MKGKSGGIVSGGIKRNRSNQNYFDSYWVKLDLAILFYNDGNRSFVFCIYDKFNLSCFTIFLMYLEKMHFNEIFHLELTCAKGGGFVKIFLIKKGLKS